MRKLLSILGIVSLTATATSNTIACNNPQNNQKLKDEHNKLKDKHNKLNDEHNKLKDKHQQLKNEKEKLQTILWTKHKNIEYANDSIFSKKIIINVNTPSKIKESDLLIALKPKIAEQLQQFHKDITDGDFNLAFPYFVGTRFNIDLTKAKNVEVNIRGINKIIGAKKFNIILEAQKTK